MRSDDGVGQERTQCVCVDASLEWGYSAHSDPSRHLPLAIDRVLCRSCARSFIASIVHPGAPGYSSVDVAPVIDLTSES
jgi:hypothetical protein